MFDASKLTTAPWEKVSSRDVQSAVVSPGVCNVASDFENDADADFVVLARNAFEVMARRGWGVTRLENSRWVIEETDRKGWLWLNGKNWIFGTLEEAMGGLVEADAWCKANISEGVIG